MKLFLTDGLNDFEAFEYEKLLHLSYFTVGQTFILKPPIEVRRGILMLKQKNIEYLGEVLKGSKSHRPIST